MKKDIYAEIIFILLTAIFIFSGISKLLHLKDLLIVFKEFPFFKYMPAIAAWMLLIVELLIGLLLLIPTFRLSGIKIMITYLSCASVYIGSVLLFTNKSLCTCTAFFKILSWQQHIFLNIILIVLGVVAAFYTINCPIPKKSGIKQFVT